MPLDGDDRVLGHYGAGGVRRARRREVDLGADLSPLRIFWIFFPEAKVLQVVVERDVLDRIPTDLDVLIKFVLVLFELFVGPNFQVSVRMKRDELNNDPHRQASGFNAAPEVKAGDRPSR
jgi:hypothetical protein